MRVSAKAWFEYQQKLHEVNAKAEQTMSAFMDKNWPADSQDIINYAYALTQRYGSAAAELACQMYDKTAAASSAYVKPAEPAELASYEDVSKLVYGTLKTPKETPRGVNRLVKRAAADTTLKNAKRDHAEWAWIPSGDTCAFCLTLASRGWQRASEAVLKGNHAQHIHANCDCNFQIRFSSKDTVEGYDPDKYLKMYEEAEGNSPDEKIKSLRRGFNTRALSQQLSFTEVDGTRSFIPKNAIITHRKVIAGKGTDIVFRHAKEYSEKYGHRPEVWKKCVGQINSDKYKFDVHWYEVSSKRMYNPKIKNFKRQK